MDNLEKHFVCPSCRIALHLTVGERFHCDKCANTWEIYDGVPNFINKDSYWAEPGFTRKVLQEINKDIKKNGWQNVLRHHDSIDVRQQYTFISNNRRARWFDLLDIPADSTILDLGAGMGTISQILSKKCRTVYAVEPVKERTDFMRTRFQQEGCENIVIIKSDIDNLPFSKNKFDLIVLNGVLEWLPFNKIDMNPRKAQIYYLKLLKPFLKRGGYVYIGIENRLDYGHFLGTCDPHVPVKYVTILPRLLSHIICKFKTGDIYRPYLYSHTGYKRLLRNAGFESIEIYSALPSYNDPQYIESLEKNSILFKDKILTSKRKPAQLIKKILLKTDTLKYIGYAYIIFAKNE